MKTMEIPILLLGLGVAMCGPKEHPQPATQAKAEAAAKPLPEEALMADARWIEVSAALQRFMIVKIADAGNRPDGAFDGMEAYGNSMAGKNVSKAVHYILVPDGAETVEIVHTFDGKRAALPKPKRIHRMPGSALYTYFLADPSRPGSLTVLLGGKTETVDLFAFSASLGRIPFFWSGNPPTIAFEEVPGWMENTGP